MPTYQYRCTKCGEELEVVQKFSDDPLEVCPACAGQLRKVFSPVGIVFKGSGFYRTDSRNGSAASEAAKKDSEAAKDKEPAAKKGDSAPADPAKSGASGASSGSGSGDSGSPGSSGSSGSSGAKKDAAKTSSASAPAATGS